MISYIDKLRHFFTQILLPSAEFDLLRLLIGLSCIKDRSLLSMTRYFQIKYTATATLYIYTFYIYKYNSLIL